MISGHVRITVIEGTLLGIDNTNVRACKDNSYCRYSIMY